MTCFDSKNNHINVKYWYLMLMFMVYIRYWNDTCTALKLSPVDSRHRTCFSATLESLWIYGTCFRSCPRWIQAVPRVRTSGITRVVVGSRTTRHHLRHVVNWVRKRKWPSRVSQITTHVLFYWVINLDTYFIISKLWNLFQPWKFIVLQFYCAIWST